MTTLMTVLPTFHDLKMKSSGKGGLSDGGCICKSETVTGSVPVVVAPPKGVNWGGITLSAEQRGSAPGGVTGWNFDAALNCKIEEYLVLEDGTEVLTGTATTLAKNTPEVGSHKNVSLFFAAGGILSFPNKLKYKLIAGSGAIPTGRVLIKTALVEYDQPSDEV